jgi:SpoVK/Ycf46/Vps4 family AAA+-type ATPase
MERKVLIKQDLEESILKAKPSSIKDLIATVPKVLWSEIGGYENVKLQLQ